MSQTAKCGVEDLGELRSTFPDSRIVIADAGHDGPKLALKLRRHDGYQLRIAKRRHQIPEIGGLIWIVDRSFAWLGLVWGISSTQRG